MPTVKIKVRRGQHVDNRDANRANKLQRALLRVSVKQRRKEPDIAGIEPAKKRSDDDSLEVIPPQQLNKRGDQRGVHNRENPPDSDRMRKIRAMRKVYNKQMPVLACNSCSFAQSCPKFRAGYECAFLPFLNSHGVETPEDLMDYMQDLVASNARRLQLAATFETLSGAPPSLELSESAMMLFTQMEKLHDKMTAGGTEVTLETDDSSVISKLFGGLSNLIGNTEAALDNPIDASIPALRDMGEAKVVAPDSSNVNMEVSRDFAKSELARDDKRGNTKTVAVSDVVVI